MKPNWKQAPAWAEYLAQDEDGKWYWFEHKPSRWNETEGKWLTDGSRCELAPHSSQTLEARKP